MDQQEQRQIEVGRKPMWQIWALIAVLIGCGLTLAATLYDIA